MRPPEPFRCHLSHVPGRWIVAATGELDLATLPEIELPLDIACSGPDPVTLDLSGLDFMDSSGLRMVIRLLDAGRRHGYELRVVPGDDAIRRILEVAGLTPHLRLVDEPEPVGPAQEHAVIATDAAGVVRLWNAAAERLYGWSEDEVVGRPITGLTVGPQDQETAEAIMDGIRREGRWSGEFRVQRKDGTSFPAHVENTLVEDEGGLTVGIVGVSVALRDVHSVPA